MAVITNTTKLEGIVEEETGPLAGRLPLSQNENASTVDLLAIKNGTSNMDAIETLNSTVTGLDMSLTKSLVCYLPREATRDHGISTFIPFEIQEQPGIRLHVSLPVCPPIFGTEICSHKSRNQIELIEVDIDCWKPAHFPCLPVCWHLGRGRYSLSNFPSRPSSRP